MSLFETAISAHELDTLGQDLEPALEVLHVSLDHWAKIRLRACRVAPEKVLDLRARARGGRHIAKSNLRSYVCVMLLVFWEHIGVHK